MIDEAGVRERFKTYDIRHTGCAAKLWLHACLHEDARKALHIEFYDSIAMASGAG